MKNCIRWNQKLNGNMNTANKILIIGVGGAGVIAADKMNLPNSKKFKWIYFDSPGWTWQQLCGRAGPMSICSDCGCLVEFICEIMN